MTNELKTLSASALVRVFNAVTTGAPVKKFESQPRGLARRQEAILKAGFTEREAMDWPSCSLSPSPCPSCPPRATAR